MGVELKTDSWHRYMLYRHDDIWLPRFDTPQERADSVEAGKKFAAAAYADVWAKDADLVKRVRQFIGNNFHWHERLAKSGADLDVVQTLQDMVRGGSVLLIPEEPRDGGGIAWPPKQQKISSFWGVSNYDSTPFVSVKDRYLAQLEQMSAERPGWAETQAMQDGINADFMAQMAGTSPILDAMLQAAGWTDKYPDAAGGGASLLSDAQPFEYGEAALPGDSMDIAGMPFKGAPGSWAVSKPGSILQWRQYGAGGTPITDFDFEAHHGNPNPHAHDWDGTSRDQGWPVSILP
jgi:hypothetical protein